MAPSCQEWEPPQIPGRFTLALRHARKGIGRIKQGGLALIGLDEADAFLDGEASLNDLIDR